MTKHDFIFSEQQGHRILRHVVFWVVWWLAFLVLFHYPVHSFKGWSLNEAPPAFEKLGLFIFVLKTLVFNTLLGVLLTQIAFTYFFIYYLLPNYFYRKRNPWLIGAVLSIALLIHFILSVGTKSLVPIGNYLLGIGNFDLQINNMFRIYGLSALRDQITSLPIITGFAVMIKMIKRWWLKYQEAEQLSREKAQIELQLLKSQIHPHFLFNTLNNIYFFTLSGSPKAPVMIKKLSSILYYILNECSQTWVPLEKEIKLIEDYMELEKIRYGDELNMTVILPDNDHGKMIAPLLLIPFVENSFKHGASKMLIQPYVTLRLTIEYNELHFFVMNGKPAIPETNGAKANTSNPSTIQLAKPGNIGLKNVKKRLQLIYPDDHELNIVSEPERFAVYLKLQLNEKIARLADQDKIQSISDYAMV